MEMDGTKVKKVVRFGGHLAAVIEEYNDGITDNYDIIIGQIQDPLIKSTHLQAMLQQFTQVVQLLEKNHRKLVSHLLGIQWIVREKQIIELYLEFLMELITANPVHQVQILNCLVKHFLPPNSIVKGSEACVPLEEIFQMIHHTLKKIFVLIPLTPSLVFPLMASNYPFMKKELNAIELYVKNLVFVAMYQQSLRAPILELIVSKALKLDALCPDDVIKKALLEEESMFEMDTDHAEKRETFIDKLDTVMETLLRFIRDASLSGNDLSLQAHTLFKELVLIFDKVILPIHDCSHVQFIMFFVCSFKTSFFEKFRDHLWKKVQNPSTPVITRQTILSYLASLLARGKFIPLPAVLDTLNTMISWIHSYINERDGDSSFIGSLHESARHGTFYSACQGVFYILVFRHKEILDLKDGFNLTRHFKLEHIVTSRLNPLKFCLSAIVMHFASIMRQHQIVYCNTIIEKNNRQTLPIHGQNSVDSVVNPLDSFFPFDPYLLPSSAHFFDDLYQEWEANVAPVDETHDNDENDNDIFGISPMDIPNVADHGKHFSDSLGGKSAGFSPAFALISPSPF